MCQEECSWAESPTKMPEPYRCHHQPFFIFSKKDLGGDGVAQTEEEAQTGVARERKAYMLSSYCESEFH